MLIFYTCANFILILEFDLRPCSLKWNQANTQRFEVYSSFILTFRRYSLHLFAIKNRFIFLKWCLGTSMKTFF